MRGRSNVQSVWPHFDKPIKSHVTWLAAQKQQRVKENAQKLKFGYFFRKTVMSEKDPLWPKGFGAKLEE